METDERRSKIMEILQTAKKPLSGTELAGQFGVSRQIVVGDISVLRAAGNDITATNNGYILNLNKEKKFTDRVKVSHKPDDVFDELCTIIDEGARVKGMEIEHTVLGCINIPMAISSRTEAAFYSEKMQDSVHKHPGALTGGVHFHMIEADDMITLLRVQKKLNEKGYLSK